MNIQRDKQLQIYLDALKHFKNIPKQQELELVRQYHKTKDKKLLKRIVEANLRFVVKVAHKYANEHVDIKDLISEGNIGLLIAVEKFNPNRDVKFLSYAVWWIRQTIIKYLYDSGRLVRFPINRISKINKINKLCEESLQKFQNIDIEYISKKLKISQKQLTDAIFYDAVSIDKTHDEDDSSFTLHEVLGKEDETENDIDSEQTINYLCKGLSKREQKILKLYFIDHLSLETLGKRFKLTKERVRQIKEKSLKKMQTSHQFLSFF